MPITLTLIVTFVAYILGAVTKAFIPNLPNRYIPIQNVIIGLISGLLCFFLKVETNLLTSLVTYLISTMSAGGIADLISMNTNFSNEESG